MKVLITGANGFLGSHLCRIFYKNGHEVSAFFRKGSSTQFINKSAHHLIETTYEESQLDEYLNRVDLLIHVAAKASDWGNYEDFYKANVTLAQTVHKIAACKQNLKVIHISSDAVLGEEDCRQAKNEECAYNAYLPYFLEKLLPSGMNHYKVTKQLGEECVRKIHRDRAHQLMILRPVWIFGPREFHAGPYEYLKTVKDGVPVMPGNNHNLFHTVYVEDVAMACLMAADKLQANELQGERIYLIGPEKVTTMNDFYSKLCKGIGKKRPLNIPYWPLLLPVTLLEAIYLLFKIKSSPLLTRARLYMMYASNIYSVEKVKRELGFVAVTDLDQAIRKTIKWWKLYKFL